MNLFRIVLSAIFWSLLAQGALAQQQSAATQRLLERSKMFEPAIVQVAENVYTAIGYQVSAHTMIVGEDDVIIVDPGQQVPGARRVLSGTVCAAGCVQIRWRPLMEETEFRAWLSINL